MGIGWQYLFFRECLVSVLILRFMWLTVCL
jgi:hypothetical protein